MKICFFGLENLPVLAKEFNHHGIGGEQVQQTLISKALSSHGHQVSMVVGDYGQPDGSEWHGVVAYKAYRSDAGLPIIRFIHPRWTMMWAALKRADADVYYASCAGMQVGLIALFCRIYKRGFVFRLASDTDADPGKVRIRYWRDKVLYEYGLRRADFVLSQHVSQAQTLMEKYGVTSHIANMLVESPTQVSRSAQSEIPVLWVNNIRGLKRPDLALTLAQRLPEWRMHMVGGPHEGALDLYESISDQAKTLPNLTFHGRVPYHDVGHFYDCARVFVNTSDIEGFPNSYLQSWCRGVPVVAFFDPGGVIHREGLGYAVSSMKEMTEAVKKLLTEDLTWQASSDRCKRYMEKYHSNDVVMAPYINAIEFANKVRKNE